MAAESAATWRAGSLLATPRHVVSWRRGRTRGEGEGRHVAAKSAATWRCEGGRVGAPPATWWAEGLLEANTWPSGVAGRHVAHIKPMCGVEEGSCIVSRRPPPPPRQGFWPRGAELCVGAVARGAGAGSPHTRGVEGEGDGGRTRKAE